MKRGYQKRRGLIWTENPRTGKGILEFNKQQTHLRWRLCRQALGSDRFTIRLKACYHSKEEMLPFCRLRWQSHAEFDTIYRDLIAIGWGSRFNEYTAATVPEGSFFPFVRMRRRSKLLVDTGCLWIGSRGSYPRIHVDNRFCRWFFPMSRSGLVIQEAFVPFGEVRQHIDYLKSEKTLGVLNHYEDDA